MIPLMEDPEPRRAATGWMYLAIVVLSAVFAVAIVAHLTASPKPRYRAAEDPVCQELLGRRKQLAAEKSTALIDQQHSTDRLKQIDNELNAEGCP